MMVVTLIGFSGVASRAESPGAPSLPPLWDAVYTVRGGGGYKDNVFLSPARAQRSAFISGGADVMVLRVATSGPQFDFFASGDTAFFPSTIPVHDEYTAFTQAQVSQEFGARWKGSLALEYFYQDQVLDTSFLEDSLPGQGFLPNSPVRGHTITARPGVRLSLPGRLWFAVELPGTRQVYQQPLDDYWKTGGKLTVGRDYGHGSSLSLGYEPSWRFNDSDPALTAGGVPIPGSRRERFQQDALLTWRHYWDAQRHWRSTLKLGGRLTRENGGGHGDYSNLSASAQVMYRCKPWEISAEGRARRYDYEKQTVPPSELEKRQRAGWSLAVRVERELTTHLKLVASYEREEARSNDLLESYTVNTVSGAVQWEF